MTDELNAAIEVCETVSEPRIEDAYGVPFVKVPTQAWLSAVAVACLFRAAAEKRFPIQGGPSVPWSYMAPHESMAEKNHGQSLARLAERGGLGCGEAELLVTGQPLYPKTGEWNWDELKRRWIERAERVNNAYFAQQGAAK